jgi:Zn-dependent protease
MTFIVVLVGWVFSLCLHEFSHALVAYYGGDTTVKDKGYLTFNPLKYTHPLYSIVLPLVFLLLGGIGLPGGAVYIETWRLRSPAWRSAVSLAGPASNAVLALLLGFALQILHPPSSGIWPGVAFLAFLQVTAVVLNLIPLPPFDGYGVIEPFLPDGIRSTLAQTRGYLSLLVLIVLWSSQAVSNAFWGFVGLLAQGVGVPLHLAALGLQLFRFWG